jgi:hypothetical protein
MARRTVEARGSASGKILTFLAVAGFIFWAGHDPAGAATLLRHVGEGIAAAIHGATEHAKTHS